MTCSLFSAIHEENIKYKNRGDEAVWTVLFGKNAGESSGTLNWWNQYVAAWYLWRYYLSKQPAQSFTGSGWKVRLFFSIYVQKYQQTQKQKQKSLFDNLVWSENLRK